MRYQVIQTYKTKKSAHMTIIHLMNAQNHLYKIEEIISPGILNLFYISWTYIVPISHYNEHKKTTFTSIKKR